jgi:hypothetical protein
MTDLLKLILGVLASLFSTPGGGGKSGPAAANQCASPADIKAAAPQQY